MQNWIQTTILVIVILAISVALRKSAHAEAGKKDGMSLYKAPVIFKYIGFGLLAFGVYVLGDTIFGNSINQHSMNYLLAGIFVATGGLLIYFQRTFYITIDAHQVVKHKMFHKEITIQLNEIQYIRYRKLMKDMIIISANGKMIIDESVTGFMSLVNELKEKTGVDIDNL
ncbi:MAG TPA: hypothetical protein PK511_15365 [Chitinophagales bacterium]|nr:hypothetical protein [Chitinophagales bacterium]HMZ89895.1 hypothetical protein [Chitinophagales bacterium]HNF70692.1 hypothetical protein [Chitinophagales bacterium]HNI55905.1 hypothetical protein [Chitinophagales bacterium]HNJ90830.1 hypothetical protein [Chitinophagales bacterium]